MLVVNVFLIFCNKLKINLTVFICFIEKPLLLAYNGAKFTRVGHEKNVKNAAVAQYWNKCQISGPKQVITYEKHNGASTV